LRDHLFELQHGRASAVSGIGTMFSLAVLSMMTEI
jgi:hypothetical protein